MKKCLYGLFALLFAAPVFAANNIKMVTYFPVPYASYGDLGVTGTCDVGLLDHCELQSGSSLKVFARSGDSGPLNTGALTVKGGSLDLQSTALNSKISGTGLTAGQTGSIGTGTLEFKHDLEVNTMPGVIQSAEATNKAVLQKLNLFEQAFPGCPDGSHEISWKRLTLNDKSGVFLVCGEAAPAEHQCPDSGIRNDPRTWWDASAQKCGCPNAGEYYHMGACCSSSTAQTNSTCWKRVDYSWTAQAKVSYQAPSVSQYSCQTSSDNRYYNLYLGNYSSLVPAGTVQCNFGSSGLSAVIPCASAEQGTVCVRSCLVESDMTGAIPSTAHVTSYKCVKLSSPSYTKSWDTGEDSRYECGHSLSLDPGLTL